MLTKVPGSTRFDNPFGGGRPEMGRLFIRKPDSESFLDWQAYREARGPVDIPSGTCLRLDVKERGHGKLTFLATLKENDLPALFLHGAIDRELLHMQGLVGLRELYLSGNGITDSGLGFLQRLQNLHRLYLYETSVTGHGAEALSRLRGLRCITFCGPRITETDLHTLKASLPGCHITVLNHNTDREPKRAPR